MNLGQTIRHGVKWSFAGKTGSHVLHFVFGIAMARLLVPADFGAMATVHAFTGFVGLLAAGGMGQSLIRAKSADPNEFEAVFTVQLVLGLLIFAGFFVTAPMVGSYFGNPLYTDLLRVAAVTFVIRPFATVRMVWLSRAMDFRRRSMIELVVALVAGFGGIAMALLGLGVWSLVLSGLLGALVTNVLLTYLVPLRPKLRWQPGAVRRHAGFGINITLSELLNYLKEQGVSLLVSKQMGAEALGLLTRAESLARMSNRFVTPPVGQVVFRAIASVQDDLDQRRYLFYRTITLLSVYVWPLLLVFLWVAEPLVVTLYGRKWLEAAEPARALAVAGFFLVVSRPSSVVLGALGRVRQEMVVQAAALVFALGAALYGLRWGLAGVAWAIVAAHVFTTIALYLLAHRATGARLRDLGRALVPALWLNAPLAVALALVEASFGGALASHPVLHLLALATIGGGVYVVAFLAMPIAALRSEAERWKRTLVSTLRLGKR